MVDIKKQIKSDGVVLKRTNYGEADRIVTLYTKNYGKLVCLAKGVRRPTSRKRAAIEIFSQIRFFAIIGKGIDILTETEIIDTYNDLRRDLVKVAYGYQVCELTDRLTVEKNDQEDVYRYLTEILGKMSFCPNGELEEAVYQYAGRLVKELGFWPKDKALPGAMSLYQYIEDTIEKEIKSKHFIGRL